MHDLDRGLANAATVAQTDGRAADGAGDRRKRRRRSRCGLARALEPFPDAGDDGERRPRRLRM